MAEKIGKLARPKSIHLADDLPKTRSGKIMRRLLRDITSRWRSSHAAAAREDEAGGQEEVADVLHQMLSCSPAVPRPSR